MNPLSQHHDLAELEISELSDLLALVYRGPLEPSPWSSLLEALRLRLDASFITLILRNPAHDRPGLIVNSSIHGPQLPGEPSYSEYYYSICPFIDWAPGQVLTADQVIGAEQWQNHDFYKSYLQPLDLRYVMVANLRTESGMHCAFFACRRHATDDFSSTERALIEALRPHLQQAVDLHSTVDELDSERMLYAATIDRLLVGTAILDETGKVMRSNQAAQRLFAANDGLECRQDKLQAYNAQDNRMLQKAVQNILTQRQQRDDDLVEVLTLSRPTGEMQLNVLLRPIALSYEGPGNARRPAVAVFIRDPSDSPQASQRLLRSLFHLTRTESEVAMLMMNGLTLDESAERLCLSRNTIRAHLRGVFAKTGATRQAQLVKTLLNSVAALA